LGALSVVVSLPRVADRDVSGPVLIAPVESSGYLGLLGWLLWLSVMSVFRCTGSFLRCGVQSRSVGPRADGVAAECHRYRPAVAVCAPICEAASWYCLQARRGPWAVGGPVTRDQAWGWRCIKRGSY